MQYYQTITLVFARARSLVHHFVWCWSVWPHISTKFAPSSAIFRTIKPNLSFGVQCGAETEAWACIDKTSKRFSCFRYFFFLSPEVFVISFTYRLNFLRPNGNSMRFSVAAQPAIWSSPRPIALVWLRMHRCLVHSCTLNWWVWRSLPLQWCFFFSSSLPQYGIVCGHKVFPALRRFQTKCIPIESTEIFSYKQIT